MTALPSLRRGWCPGALRPMRTGDGLLVRLRITGGIVPVALASAIADAAARFGNGLLDLSGRANLQIRGVSDETLPALVERLGELGLLDGDAEGEAVRNVLASPLAGLAPDALLDIRPAVRRLERRLAGDPHLHRLPSKFGFLIDDGGGLSLAAERADIRFDAVPGPGGPTIRIGLGGTARTALPAGTCAPDEIPDAAARLAAAILLDPAGPERLVSSQLEPSLAPRPPRSVAENPHGPVSGNLTGNVPLPHPEVLRKAEPRRTHDGAAGFEAGRQPAPQHEGPGSFWPGSQDRDPGGSPVGHLTFGALHVAGLGIPFGRLSVTDLDAVALAAERAGAAELRLTPWRVILVPTGEPDRLPALLATCAPHAIVRPDDPRLSVTTCAGAPGCERATTPTHADAARLAPAARALARRGVTLHLSGCRKGCAHPDVAAVTLVGDAGRYGLVLDGRASDAPVLSGLSAGQAEAALSRLARGASA